MPRVKDPLQKQIDDLTAQLEAIRVPVMRKAGYTEFDNNKVASFHGIIGGKNNEFVDAVREVFLSPQQFIDEWKQGAVKKVAERDAEELQKYGRRYQNTEVDPKNWALA